MNYHINIMQIDLSIALESNRRGLSRHIMACVIKQRLKVDGRLSTDQVGTEINTHLALFRFAHNPD